MRFLPLRILCFLMLLWPGISEAATSDNIKIYPLDAKKSGILVQSFTEKNVPLLVFIYASWCPVCRENFPYILKMAQEHKQTLNVLMFSMDSDPAALQQYLASHGTIAFTPYIVQQQHSGDFTKAMNIAGINYRNSIPYTVLYDRKGKMVGQGSIAAASIVPVVERMVGDDNTTVEKK